MKLNSFPFLSETGDPSDFTSLSESLTFTPSSSTSNRLCIDVEITDDSVVEETEQFFVDLMHAQGLDRRATLIDTATTSEIFITDNDSMGPCFCDVIHTVCCYRCKDKAEYIVSQC